MDRSCPICASTTTDQVRGPRRPWQYVACLACGHRWLDPQPSIDELTAFYNGAYAVDPHAYDLTVMRERRLLSAWIAAARSGAPPGRMLEIGCSYGGMLAAFRDEGWTVEGIEADQRAARVAKTRHGITVWEGRLETVIDRLSPPYDVIAMHHVIEHITDPTPFVARLRALAADRGTLVLRTPNVRSLAARVGAGWWQWAAAPEHVHLFSPASLKVALDRAGFSVRDVRTRRGDAHGTMSELARIAAKRLSRHRPRASTSAPTASARVAPWVDRVIDTVTTPIDVALARLKLAMPELVVIASAR